jgi:hypothetical protein
MPDNNQEIGILIKAQEQTQSAFDKATAQLGGLGKDAASASAALKRVADSFSGSKILEEAEAATRYITQLGGATALTEKEQGRLNSQITEAVAKYQALGLKAPADMKALADATAGANRSTTDILGTVGKFAGAVGIGFSVGAVINFGKSVFDTASQIHDMAEQLGISAEATQGFKFAAEQAGSSIETVGTSLTKMNKNLAEGDKSTITALKDAGLSFQEIRNMKPEDAFLAITDAIAKIPDPDETGASRHRHHGEGLRGTAPGDQGRVSVGVRCCGQDVERHGQQA